jgi:hypothetical protein
MATAESPELAMVGIRQEAHFPQPMKPIAFTLDRPDIMLF